MNSGYYSRAYKTILVPVRIRYYDTIDMLVDHVPPLHGEIANAMQSDRKRRNELLASRILIELAMNAIKDQDPLAAKQLQEANDKLSTLLETEDK